MEALHRAQLKAREFRLLLLICRKTYGFHKSRMQMSERKICEHTGDSRGATRRAFRNLVDRKVITVYKAASGKRASIFGINGDPKTWLVDLSIDPRGGSSGSTNADPLQPPSGSTNSDPLDENLVDHPERSSVDHPGGSKKWITQGDPRSGSPKADPLEGSGDRPQSLATTGVERENHETPKDILLKDNLSKENITKIGPAPPDVFEPFKKGSSPENTPTHYEPEENFGDTSNFRGSRVVYAYRLLYGGKDPGRGDLKFAAKKLADLLPAVSGPRMRRDLEGALILAARELRHDMALGREIGNPWGYVWTMIPDHLEAAKEFNYRIHHGAYPDSPASYIWDADNAVLRATKRREEFLRWMDANEAERERRMVG